MIESINTINSYTSLVCPKTSISKHDANNSKYKDAFKKHASLPISPSFSKTPMTVHTQLRTQDEHFKYSEVAKNLDADTRTKLDKLLKTGKLLNDNSNDKSTTLDNLHKIISSSRATGLNSDKLLKDVVVAIDNPYTITQKFGDIPKPIADEIVENSDKFASYETPYSNYMESLAITGKMPKKQKLTKDLLNIVSSSCVAASIQFNLAFKNPAEYARMAEKLSSEQTSVSKNIKLTDVAPQKEDALWLLKQFKVPYKELNSEYITVNMKPDRNAIIRARIQSSYTYRDPGERSPIDVLMQSTFMNIGSQHTYNALTDIRTGKFNPDNRGLTDIEKNLAEVIAQGKSKISVTYQILDESGKIVGYECSQANTLRHIKDALAMGENVIVGYTHTDENNKVINGHEITIIGIEKDKNGKEVFICNDTDDMKDEPICYNVEYLLPKIHHAGLPQSVLQNDAQLVNAWSETINQYKEVMKLVTLAVKSKSTTYNQTETQKMQFGNSIYDDNLKYRLAMAKVKLAGNNASVIS